MADTEDDLFLFGEDFDAILALLESDEAVEEQFSAAVVDVSTISVKFGVFLVWSDRKGHATRWFTKSNNEHNIEEK